MEHGDAGLTGIRPVPAKVEVRPRRVAIYHPFHDLPDNYSLSHVVLEQMLMLTEAKWPTKFITSNTFKGDPRIPSEVDVKAILPYSDAKKIYEAAKPIIDNMDVVFTHDIVYLDSYKDHEEALRRIAEERSYHTRWLHWSHSAPNPANNHKPFPHSIYVALNWTDLPLLAKQHGVPEANCRVINNPCSPDQLFEWHPFTRAIVEAHDLLNCQVLAVYPLDTGRFASKGGDKVIKLVRAMREQGLNAKVVFVNAAANAEARRVLAKEKANNYTIFTSLEDKRYEVYTPRRVVRELMQLADIFPLLSDSEGCPLTMLEAALSGCLVILNEDFPPLVEYGEIDLVAYMKVSSTRARTTYNPSEDAYYRDKAREIYALLENNRAYRFKKKVQQRYNRRWVWLNQLRPTILS